MTDYYSFLVLLLEGAFVVEVFVADQLRVPGVSTSDLVYEPLWQLPEWTRLRPLMSSWLLVCVASLVSVVVGGWFATAIVGHRLKSAIAGLSVAPAVVTQKLLA